MLRRDPERTGKKELRDLLHRSRRAVAQREHAGLDEAAPDRMGYGGEALHRHRLVFRSERAASLVAKGSGRSRVSDLHAADETRSAGHRSRVATSDASASA